MTPSTPTLSPPVAAGSAEATSPARYAYLLARLRNRQITMEEATELFGVLQGMLRDSQVARARLERLVPSGSAATGATAPRPASPAPGARPPPSDDWLLLGLLALGAGAGLGAAFARRLGAPPGTSESVSPTARPRR